ncbi:MAG: hypothetical protein MK207_01070 [Saprospiraceae bacterium]|nr:hypothetical protein [Saprospiraceae bacterium]
MKGLYLFVILSFYFCFTFDLMAQTGNCIVFSNTGEEFHLGLDNKFQNVKASTNVKVTGVPEGDYWITILFHDSKMKAVKTSLRVIGDKEISYLLEYEGEVWKVIAYNTTSISFPPALIEGQTIIAYNKAGVEVKGIRSADELSKQKVHRNSEIYRVQGNRVEHESRREKFSGSENNITNNNPDQNFETEPETGTTTISEYIEVANTDGTVSIVDQKTIIIKQIVERNGQKILRTKKNKTLTPTNFECLPMNKSAFLELLSAIENSSDKLFVAKKGVKGQCMTPKQIKTIGDMLNNDEDKNDFAIAALVTCAEPLKYPYTIKEVEQINGSELKD